MIEGFSFKGMEYRPVENSYMRPSVDTDKSDDCTSDIFFAYMCYKCGNIFGLTDSKHKEAFCPYCGAALKTPE